MYKKICRILDKVGGGGSFCTDTIRPPPIPVLLCSPPPLLPLFWLAQGKDGVPAFDIDLSFMRGVRDRVNLARRVEKGLHTLRKINEGNVRILAVVACPGGRFVAPAFVLPHPLPFTSPHATTPPPPFTIAELVCATSGGGGYGPGRSSGGRRRRGQGATHHRNQAGSRRAQGPGIANTLSLVCFFWGGRGLSQERCLVRDRKRSAADQ